MLFVITASPSLIVNKFSVSCFTSLFFTVSLLLEQPDIIMEMAASGTARYLAGLSVCYSLFFLLSSGYLQSALPAGRYWLPAYNFNTVHPFYIY